MWEQTRLCERVGSRRPVILATISQETDLSRLDEFIDAGVDIVEFRLDRMRGALEMVLASLASPARDHLGTIVTYRSPDEGGADDSSEEERIQALLVLLPHVDGVDIELKSAKTLNRLRGPLADHGKTLILSHHDFSGSLDREAVGRQWKFALEQGADLVKVASVSPDFVSTNEYLRFAAECPQPERFIGIPMGVGGTYGRFVLPLLACPIAYGGVAPHFAPGQPPVIDLIDFYRLAAPGYNDAYVQHQISRDRTFDSPM